MRRDIYLGFEGIFLGLVNHGLASDTQISWKISIIVAYPW